MFSWVALDRVAAQERAKDATFRKQSTGKVLRSDAQSLTDDDLLAKLRSFGIELDRASLERLCREALSAEEIATPLLDQRTFPGRQAAMESDWIWVCLTALWQRWFPDQPCFELLDDKMQAGYELQAAGEASACLRLLEALCLQPTESTRAVCCFRKSVVTHFFGIKDIFLLFLSSPCGIFVV